MRLGDDDVVVGALEAKVWLAAFLVVVWLLELVEVEAIPLFFCSSTVGCWPCCDVVKNRNGREQKWAWKHKKLGSFDLILELQSNCRTAEIWTAYPGFLQLTAVDRAAHSNPAFFGSLMCPISHAHWISRS
jgi:hypothetical protein